jgi:hypothetical protein
MSANVKTIQCPSCGGSSAAKVEQCTYCGNYLLHLSPFERTHQGVAGTHPYFRSLKKLYRGAMVTGLALMILIYFVLFSRLSEDELVAVSPIWFLLIIFGAGGIYSEKAVGLILEKRANTFHSALIQSIKSLSPVLMVGMFVLFLIPAILMGISKRLSSPLLITMIVTAVWALILYLFLMGIFPSL